MILQIPIVLRIRVVPRWLARRVAFALRSALDPNLPVRYDGEEMANPSDAPLTPTDLEALRQRFARLSMTEERDLVSTRPYLFNCSSSDLM
jgi:hypothetical protein